jgi:PAT family beta-lactamase induction signal transducer AmpG
MSQNRAPHPSAFMFLIVPFGAQFGFVQVALAYLLAQNKVSVEAIAALLAAGLAPNVWKFAWAPIVDTTLTAKRWYLIGLVGTVAGVIMMAALPMTPASLPLLTAIFLWSSVTTTFIGMACECLLAELVPPGEKGRAGGWYQGGNLGGGAIGGGLGLALAKHVSSPVLSGIVVSALLVLCALPLLWMHEPPRPPGRRPVELVKFVFKDVLLLLKARMGFVALFLCFLPIGSGAASGLWSAVASDWKASADTVALVTGVVGGIVMIAGTLSGGWICDRMDRKRAYVVFGLVQAICAVSMGLAPKSPGTYTVFTLLYGFSTGLTYAGFTAFVLEAMGQGAAATKYNAYASLSNFPIMYMTTLDGKAHTRWGSSGMLYFESLWCVGGMVVFLLVAALLTRFWPKHWPNRVEELEAQLSPAPIE